MSPLSLLGYVYRQLASLFDPTSSTVYSQKKKLFYSLILHDPRIFLYRGAETYATFSIIAYTEDSSQPVSLDQSQAEKAKVQLVQKGWRAGIFGWNLASYLGAKTKSGWDVTPEASARWQDAQSDTTDDNEYEDRDAKPTGIDEQSSQTDSTNSRGSAQPLRPAKTKHVAAGRKKKIEASIEQKANAPTGSAEGTGHPLYKVVGTFKCRIPVASGDGYFRFYVTLPDAQIASPTLRLFSFSLSSASPRGATLLPLPTIAPELVLRSVSLVLSSLLFAAFPVVSLVDKILPRWLSRRFARWAFRKTGGEEKKQKLMKDYKIDQRVDQAKQQVQKVPFASAGVRTEWDLAKDASRGRGGWIYTWA